MDKKRTPPQSHILQTVQKTGEQWENLTLFPTVSMDDGDPEWEPISFKLLKELKDRIKGSHRVNAADSNLPKSF